MTPEGAAQQLYKSGEVEYNPFKSDAYKSARYIAEMDRLTREELKRHMECDYV
jgi:hypothetical protein